MAHPGFAFTKHYEGIVSEIHTEVLVGAHALPSYRGAPVLTLPAVALWDTGASQSSISKSLADRLGLVAFNQTLVAHAGGFRRSEVFLAEISPPNAPGALTLEVLEFISIPEFDVIIGMDIITLGDFAITNYGGYAAPRPARFRATLRPVWGRFYGCGGDGRGLKQNRRLSGGFWAEAGG